MSSLGGQWRVIRHYLSLNNLQAELDKLLQRFKPSTPDQWDNVLRRFEKVVSARLTSGAEATKADTDTKVSTDTNVSTDTKVSATTTKSVPKPETKTLTNEQGVSKAKEVAVPGVGSEVKELSFDSLWQGLRLKKDIQLGKISEPMWRDHKPSITKTSIHSRTAYVIGAVLSGASRASVLARAATLVHHLHSYPEARDYAIKEGAVRVLLRVQDSLDLAEPIDREIDGVINEALSLVGYCGPPRGPGANVLALDGGGIRGIIAIELLRHLEQLTGRRASELFDYVVGVSTGAIIAAVLGGAGTGSLDAARHMYYTLSREMFGNTSLLGGGARLVWTHSYYDTAAWEKMLRDNLGERTLTQCNRLSSTSPVPKLALVSCVVSGSRLSPFLFRSYSVGWRLRSVFPGTSRAKLWHAVRASAAAPTYFDEFKLDGLLHQDGGIMVNNPTGVGVHEAKLLYGASAVRRGTVVSLGTGRPLGNNADYGLITQSLGAKQPQGTSWKDKFNKILDSATDTEGVHLVMNDLLPPGSYYRFNPPLMEQCAMDEINTDKLDRLVEDTHAYIRRNQHKFEQAAAMLTRARPLGRRALDWATRRAHIAGALAHTHA